MKKVRYLMGAIGVAPAAFGLIAPVPSAAATTHTAKPGSGSGQTTSPAKAVSLHHSKIFVNNGCTGHNYHSKSHNGLLLAFWSTPNGAKTCIGTIKVFGNGHAKSVEDAVIGTNGNAYCVHRVAGNFLSIGCHASFYRPFSVGGESYPQRGTANVVRYRIG